MVARVENVEMAAAWDGEEGDDWARDWKRYDRGVAGYHRLLMAAAAITPTDRVLDVGCGNGQTTRDAARAAPAGTALGLDLSSKMLARAAELARAEGVGNVAFEQGDAQAHPFAPGAYDVVISRFGMMFFADPVAALANIGGAMPAGGRLVSVAWRTVADNEWLDCILSALAVGRDLPVAESGAPGPFGMADPDQTRTRLEEAGYVDVSIDGVDALMHFGDDADDAFSFVAGTGIVRGMTAGLDDDLRRRALDALRATMADHESPDGVTLRSQAWLVGARRA